MTILTALCAAAPVGEANKSEKKAHAFLVRALEARMDGRDADARKFLSECLRWGPERGSAHDNCTIDSDLYVKDALKPDGPKGPAARKLYREGVAAYKKKDLRTAGRKWRDCLEASDVGTVVRNDCLAMAELTPVDRPAATSPAAQQRFLEGMIDFQKGDYAAALTAWEECAAAAPAGSPEQDDCRAAQERAKAMLKK